MQLDWPCSYKGMDWFTMGFRESSPKGQLAQLGSSRLPRHTDTSLDFISGRFWWDRLPLLYPWLLKSHAPVTCRQQGGNNTPGPTPTSILSLLKYWFHRAACVRHKGRRNSRDQIAACCRRLNTRNSGSRIQKEAHSIRRPIPRASQVMFVVKI